MNDVINFKKMLITKKNYVLHVLCKLKFILLILSHIISFIYSNSINISDINKKNIFLFEFTHINQSIYIKYF